MIGTSTSRTSQVNTALRSESITYHQVGGATM